MNKKFKLYNTVLGWIVFAIAAYTYVSTAEPTASLWDCGEFIATSYKLEVGHPPGAPFFNIIQKVVSLLAGNDVTKVAYWMNITSAISSALTILFLFWSISHIARRLLLYFSKQEQLTTAQIIAVLGSATVGALAYTFSDTFWFSAVEAEVYAMSSLFTALVFWLALKWEEQADKPYADRWLVLIGLLIGMSIGVHLLNLLVIPAIGLIYYFRKTDKPTTKGIIVTLAISSVILVVIMYGIIQGLVVLGSWFELLFVNGFGLPFESGFFTFLALLFGGIILGLYLTYKRRKYLWHNTLLFLLMILMGYSVFAEVVIRSNANPPIDENDPEYSFALKSYLNREQYGDRPLIYGQYYDAQIVGQEDQYTYIKGKNKYIKVKKANPKYLYDPARKTLFPRMYSSQPDHIQAYKAWGGVRQGEKPTFINNLRFFFSYQLGFMYFRYFFWNFVGKQNDIQGHGGILHGNWLSGINFIDNMRLGPQDKLPEKWKNMASRNKYYFLPLILGLIGLWYTIKTDNRYFWVIFVFFFMTGIAIVLYLNQTPYQPRERDYAYAGSFYAYAMWIGLGVLALYEWFKKILKNPVISASIASVLALFIPIQMGAENWDDHDRSGRYHTRDYAANYLNSCAENAILFTYGDNDTFPLWYDQEVEGIRTDVRDVNLSLFTADWYIKQMQRKAYESDPLPIPVDYSKYHEGVRDIIIIYERPDLFFDEKYNANKVLFEDRYKKLFNRTLAILKNSEFKKLMAKDYERLTTKGYKGIKIKQFVNFVNKLNNKKIANRLKINKDTISVIAKQLNQLKDDIAHSYLPIDLAIRFTLSDDQGAKLQLGGENYNYLPSRKLLIPVDKEKVIRLGIVPKDKQDKIVDAIRFTLPKKQYLIKNNWMQLVILANFDWERPIYFATSIGNENYLGLKKYFRLEGFAYRLVPYPNENAKANSLEIGSINTDILYDNVMNKFKWGRIYEPDFNVDHYVDRTTKVMDIRGVFHRLADALIKENKIDSAKQVLDKIVKIMPDNKFPYDFFVLPVAEDYFRIGEKDKALAILKQTFENYRQEAEFFKALKPEQLSGDDVQRELTMAFYSFGEILNQLNKYAKDEKTFFNQVQQEQTSLISILNAQGLLGQ